MKSKELLLKHLALNDCKGYVTSDGRLYKAIINALEEAINYTHCCTELKDKEALSFDEWLKDEDIKMHQDGTFYIRDERRYVNLDFLINRYNSLNL